MSGHASGAGEAWARLAEVGRGVLREVTGAAPAVSGALLEAVGWATVDLDRAAAEFDAGSGVLGGAGWISGRRDVHLGAAARLRVPPPAAGLPALVFLEPDTEGRLARQLARHGEAVVAIYVSAPGGAASRASLGGVAGGPLGPARRLLGRPPNAPEVLILERPPDRP